MHSVLCPFSLRYKHLVRRADSQAFSLMYILCCSDHLMEEDFSSLLVTDFLGHAPAARPTTARPVPVDLSDVLAQSTPDGSPFTHGVSPGMLVGDFSWKQFVK